MAPRLKCKAFQDLARGERDEADSSWNPENRATEGLGARVSIGDDGGPSNGTDSGLQKSQTHLPPPLAGPCTGPGPRGRPSAFSSRRCSRHAAHLACKDRHGELTWLLNPGGLARLRARIGSHCPVGPASHSSIGSFCKLCHAPQAPIG